MKKIENRSGVTLIELLFGILSAAVLAAVLSVMLFYGYLTWVRNNRSVDLHRDATLAMQTMQRSLRQASAAGVDLSQPNQIIVSNQGSAIISSFYQQGSNLFCNPALNNGGTPFLLINGGVLPSGFTHSNIAGGASIRMRLRQGMEYMEMNGSICFRN